jgi:hypothetical protein
LSRSEATSPARDPEIRLRPRAAAAFLACTIGALIAAHAAGQIAKYRFGHDHLHGAVPLFYLGGEANIPTWFSAAQALACAIVLAVIAVIKRQQGAPFVAHWAGLAAGFVYLSLDEAAGIHERLGPPMSGVARLLSDTAGGWFVYLARVPGFSWTLPAAAAVAILAATYLPFLLALPRNTRVLSLIAGAMFVGGAIGVELAGARHVALWGSQNPQYVALVTLEETLEMGGAALFLCTLLSYLQAEVGSFWLTLRSGNPPGGRPPSAVGTTPNRR